MGIVLHSARMLGASWVLVAWAFSGKDLCMQPAVSGPLTAGGEGRRNFIRITLHLILLDIDRIISLSFDLDMNLCSLIQWARCSSWNSNHHNFCFFPQLRERSLKLLLDLFLVEHFNEPNCHAFWFRAWWKDSSHETNAWFSLNFLKTCRMCLSKPFSNCPKNQTCLLYGHINTTKQGTKKGLKVRRRCYREARLMTSYVILCSSWSRSEGEFRVEGPWLFSAAEQFLGQQNYPAYCRLCLINLIHSKNNFQTHTYIGVISGPFSRNYG